MALNVLRNTSTVPFRCARLTFCLTCKLDFLSVIRPVCAENMNECKQLDYNTLIICCKMSRLCRTHFLFSPANMLLKFHATLRWETTTKGSLAPVFRIQYKIINDVA